jgi:hypothetical protein
MDAYYMSTTSRAVALVTAQQQHRVLNEQMKSGKEMASWLMARMASMTLWKPN